jgi:hypothetical protein
MPVAKHLAMGYSYIPNKEDGSYPRPLCVQIDPGAQPACHAKSTGGTSLEASV